jgi:aconitate hydratase
MHHDPRPYKNLNSFKTETQLAIGTETFSYHSLSAFEKTSGKSLSKFPYSMKILLENLLRHEDDLSVRKTDIENLANWDPKAEPNTEIQFMPSRVLLQDFTGVPAVADLAAMRKALKKLGGDPDKINPLQPADLVIDHSVQVDFFGSSSAFQKNMDLEFERNGERYTFLKWGQTAFQNFRVVPPDTGIVHQVNLEYLAQVAMVAKRGSQAWIYPDTVIGTDSHTTMINGLGVLGWGVGGIEAEAAMLGQPCSMLIPQVVGFRLRGNLKAGVTATDLVLTVTQILRKKGVVGKFVEFFGPGLSDLTLADRATIANMAPEYGATCGIFPVDSKTTDYLILTGRKTEALRLEAYAKAQHFWYDPAGSEAEYTDVLDLDLGSVEPSLAGPARPQDRVTLSEVAPSFTKLLDEYTKGDATKKAKKTAIVGGELTHGDVVICAITSCTNTSNPSVLMAAGLVAEKAVARGLKVKPWVKTSLAPGSKVVTDYLREAGLLSSLEKLNFHLVGYGCTTCIGNSGPLPESISKAVSEGELAVASVLSGNRNFEGRVNNQVRANYLASPPLVVAYALAGTVQIDLSRDPIGTDSQGKPVYLKDLWPTHQEVADKVSKFVTSKQFATSYAEVFRGEPAWQKLTAPQGTLYDWDPKSTYIKEPPYFENMQLQPSPRKAIEGARCLAILGDSITTDHISPAGSFSSKTPAGQYLMSLGVDPKDFNQYGARRGNHEIMVRGTFANVRLKNGLVPGVEGGFTEFLPEKKQMTIFDASMEYQKRGIPLIILAGKEYGSGSSRDWAAKGPKLLGIQAVIAESFERIHRSNLVGMGILPLQFLAGESPKSFGLTGRETFEIRDIESLKPAQKVVVAFTREDGTKGTFLTLSRVDTPNEVEYYRHGGILSYVLRQIASS